MPNRILRESITTSDTIDQLDDASEAFFYRLLVVADDFGLMDGRPSIIKSRCYASRVDTPRDVPIARIGYMLAALDAVDLITMYEVDGRSYLAINKWDQHQRVRNAKSRHPAPPGSNLLPVASDSPSIDRDSLSSVGPHARAGTRVLDSDSDPDSTTQQVAEVFEFWRATLDHPQAKLDTKRRKAIRGRLTEGYAIADLLAAIRGCKASPFHMGDNDRQRRFDDIELICRDAKRVDQFIALARAGPQAKKGNTASVAAAIFGEPRDESADNTVDITAHAKRVA